MASIHPPDDALPAEAPPAALWLTVPQAAALLQIGEGLAYELVAAGKLPAVRLGPRSTRVARAVLEEWARTGPADGADT
jgi:excisionase family DNA binding protein